MGEGLFPDEATMYITSTSVNPSALAASDAVTGEVGNYSETGGEKDQESIPVFGGGNVDKENPVSQVEVSFDVVMQYLPPQGVATKWDAFKFGAGLTSATNGAAQRVYVQWTDGSTYYSRGYNNAKAVTWNPTSSADGNLGGTITFKLSPTDASAAANLKVVLAAASTITW